LVIADNYAVAITDGLLPMVDAREIAGVLAQHFSHIRHRDMMVLVIAGNRSTGIRSPQAYDGAGFSRTSKESRENRETLQRSLY
jgi:Zn-dependent protease with chaperone function